MKSYGSVLVALALILGIAVTASADPRSLTLRTGETALTLQLHERGSLHYTVSVTELVALDVNTDEGVFTRLMIPGFHSSHDEGSPELPMMNRLIEIPHSAQARIEVISAQSRVVNLADYGIHHPIFPAQPSMPKSGNADEWPFVIDRQAYERGRVERELVHVEHVGRLRAVGVGRLEVAPVVYFPRENQIEIFDSIEFRVVFDGADEMAERDLKLRTASPFFDVVYGQMEGYRGIHEQYPDLVSDVVTMVIVTPPEFEAQLQEFVEWKMTRGFITIVGVLGTPEVGTTTASIRSYLHGLYNDATPEQPAPSFVLFVGDVAQMPTFFMGGNATDRPYCAVDADLMPDMYYGRFSATNPSQLQAMIDKTLMYDQFTMPDPSYLGEVVMIAGMDSGFGAVHGNGHINYGTSHYFNASHGIYSHTYLYPESGSNSANIIQNVSDGVAYINYTAHGSNTSWSNPSFTQSDINNLQNYGKYCLAVGNCCLTSTYDYGECFAETWLRAPEKGAIGYIGGSASTYWNEDYWWGVGYTSNINANPTYEQTNLGMFDGLFHSHGEAMEQWYVTNDALVFCGNLAVTESGSSRIEYYWNIYNLMGDPSISTFMGVPSPNNVVHPPILFTTWTSFTIEADPGSYVGLTRDGELLAAGSVRESGVLELEFRVAPLSPGPAQLLVMAQNRIPYSADINVIVPATVYIDPEEIDANVETDISVGVFEYDGVTPRVGVEVWAAGLEYQSESAFTDATGYCTITVDYPYGPSIDIVGKDPADPWDLFREPIVVNALPLSLPYLSVTTDIGLNDAFALNLPGTLHAQVSEPGHTLYALLNGDILGSTFDTDLTVTPTALGHVTGIIAVSGYNLYQRQFEVIEAYGTLTGHVSAAGSPASGAVVRGYDEDKELVFQATANAQGNYDVGEDILVALYTIKVDYFGYLPYEMEFFVNYGANVLDIDLDAAPSGVLTGLVSQEGTGLPLEATIRVFRTDTGDLYAETMSSPVDGSYTTPSLPYFDYEVTVRAWYHIPQTVLQTIDQPVVDRDFVLAETIGNILVVGDPAKDSVVPPRLDEKTGLEMAPGYAAEPKAAADIVADLEDLGYTVTLESISVTDPSTWPNYDLLVVSCGNNTSTLSSSAIRTAMINYVLAGGKLLLEGGEVAYNHRNDSNFSAHVMHITGWNGDSSGNVTVADPNHYVMSVPNVITGPVSVSYSGYGDQDRVPVASTASRVGAWTNYQGDGSVIAYDPNPAPEGGQIVFYTFNYSAMDAAVRPLLLQNTVIWLTTHEAGDCSVSGTALLQGETDHSGIRVEAIPNGGYTYTNQDGEYMLPDLFAGTYTVRATKEGWSTGVEEVTLSQGQQMTDVDFLLTPVFVEEICRHPNMYIPDNTAIHDEMPVAIGSTVTDIEVYVNITHTWIGDLIVSLTSPGGTTVVLHNRTGGSADDIVGWYPGELTPHESLDAFIGETTDGDWRLTVSDNAGGDQGYLNTWCLRFTSGADPADVAEDTLPASLRLRANHPNPMSRLTSIRFDLPKDGPLDLSIYDVAGRRVATLLAGTMLAGSHEAVWNGRDASGQSVSSGVYFYRLKTAEAELTRKLMLLK